MIQIQDYRPNNFIISSGLDSKEVMRITADGIHVNPDISIDEASQHVINALEQHIKTLVAAEREKAAKVCEEGTALTAYQSKDCYSYARNRAAAIRARGEK
jgi:hypothetical protein